jgi:hypothetical protein
MLRLNQLNTLEAMNTTAALLTDPVQRRAMQRRCRIACEVMRDARRAAARVGKSTGALTKK